MKVHPEFTTIRNPLNNTDWQEDARCNDMDASEAELTFFPERELARTPREVKQYCLGCDVVEKCLNYAIDTNTQYGYWGGMSRGERLAIARQRRNAEVRADIARRQLERDVQ